MAPDSNSTPQAAPGGLGRRWLFAILITAFLFVLMPFLFWRATWFGRPLSDAEITRYLADHEHPRKAQHALSQIADRILSRDANVRASARSWYPAIVSLASSNHSEVRLMAAWVMGQDNSSEEFHAGLRRLVADSNPMVRRNAALGLAWFHDPIGREEARSMLGPGVARANAGGALHQRLKPGDTVNPGTLLARIETGQEQVECRIEIPGSLSRWLVEDGAAVLAGTPIAEVSPSQREQWEALRALYWIGQGEDLGLVNRLAVERSDVPPSIRQQAALTAQAIRARNSK